jgi:hypothetical protein
MQQLQQVNVIHAYMISHTVLPTIVTVHKNVEIEPEDGSKPKHNSTDLCREVMRLMDSLKRPLFDAIILVESGFNKGSAIITYCTNSKEAAVLVKKIKRCAPGWFFGY